MDLAENNNPNCEVSMLYIISALILIALYAAAEVALKHITSHSFYDPYMESQDDERGSV